jgi:hypothetical protein
MSLPLIVREGMNECCSITLTLLDATGVDDSGARQLLSWSKQWLFDRQLGNWEPSLNVVRHAD